jgi:hypothetical protein
MDLIPIHANPELDWCKRTKPYYERSPFVRREDQNIDFHNIFTKLPMYVCIDMMKYILYIDTN